MKRYKITNTTIKPLIQDRQGNDIRPMRDRVGHPVEIVTGKKPNEMMHQIYPNHYIILDEVTQGMLNLYQKRVIRIEEAKDISEELRQFASQPEQAQVDPAPHKAIPADIGARAALIGEVTPLVETQKAVNPDGDPGNTVKAPRGGMKKGAEQVKSETAKTGVASYTEG